MLRFHSILAAMLFAAGCREKPSQGAPAKEAARAFRDVTSASGIRHRHHKPVLDHKLDNIMPWVSSVGAAACAGDYDGDGRIDLYVTDSRKSEPNYLYRNKGDGTFEDVSRAAGLADLNGDDGTCMDCAWGDYDNDGDPDLYVVRWGRDALFRNDGGGRFKDVTAELFVDEHGKPGMPWANGNAVIWFDFNGDGRLDLYVGNYFAPFDLWNLPHTRIMHDSFERSRNAGRNFLFRQQPDGTFRNVAAELGVDDPGWTLAVGSGDVNNDGWPDLYAADDFGPDQLWLNRGDATFENVTDEAIGSDTKKGMNAEFGDFDNDGWIDIYVTNITTAEYLQEGNMLWHNEGPEGGTGANGRTGFQPVNPGRVSFVDVSLQTGTYDGGWCWGAKFFDYDCDGDLDLLAVNGFISAGEGSYWKDLANWTTTGQDVTDARNWPAIGNRSFSGHEPNRLWRNDGAGRFTEVARASGMEDLLDGRGVVVLDYDDDGRPDVFIANQDQPPVLYHNESHEPGNWLKVEVTGDPAQGCTRDAVGARVTVITDAGMQIREKDGGNGYSGQSDPRLHFGLGKATVAKLVEVRWPGGQYAQYYEDVPTGKTLRARQDASRLVATKLERQAPERWRPSESPPPPPSMGPEEQEAYLTQTEASIRIRSHDMQLQCRYRARAAEFGRHDRAIGFLRERSAAEPDNLVLRINYGSSFIDKIPTCGGLAAVVCKGTLARQSLDVFDEIVAARPDWWLAYYVRGMNHLHWPAALGHLPEAIEDFKKCLALHECRPGSDATGKGAGGTGGRGDGGTGGGGVTSEAGHAGDAIRPYCVRAHVGLGDAYAKNKQYAEARAAWQAGLAQFPNDAALRERLAITDDANLAAYIKDLRGLERPIDTDLAFTEE